LPDRNNPTLDGKHDEAARPVDENNRQVDAEHRAKGVKL
jgi:hypothetical protein